MTVPVTKSRDILVRKALLTRGLRVFAPMYARLVQAADELEHGDNRNPSMMVPVWGVIKSLDGLAGVLVRATGREFPKQTEEQSPAVDTREAARRVSKTLREISDWADRFRESMSKLDAAISERALKLRDRTMEVSLSLDDVVVPEHQTEATDVRENLLLEEYRKLAGIKLK